ncbi:LLM class flavin-dependent oxidoreductase [Allobranchiibius huperziae]|uniref:Alkanesulfonate monooxygenase SsuD/methylene tetrahydromethanopterin reductase-like flavin-dependent oxidoreductase (Luciferase family) n=1 Tax=Allobranchiibius huperziae TaxID=1874116 RepID=A0A853DIU8_9MICO|nr:LLM class flavin-dependent oxidoreductase [Allobranchiibius huperziae]NYJ75963.1 alkanesulfonate monooxygenase SsuD/methylene tetrahydromethanopterin reductase-like flavin-dependent oxidoreductase (luciferase family) [Allobranchiibius huperziae]
MRFGITILPEHRWSDAAPLWRAAEELGFDHLWTYDHLTWGGLPDSPWFGTMPTLTAAAMVTSRARLGTFVSSPNFRDPVTFMRDILAVDDISAGRLIVGIGVGGDRDSQVIGQPTLSTRERVDRYEEFVTRLDTVLREDHVSYDGAYFRANDARTLPRAVQNPRPPFILAANGPRSISIAAERGNGWVTYGKPADEPTWWAGLADVSERMTCALAAREREDDFERHLNLDGGGAYALSSVEHFADMVGRAEELGFTDVITHWPRPDGPYAGSRDVLEAVADRYLTRP